jgi:predicted ribosome quality control (RQC) complex YloA/Tae2 family protein
MKIKRYRSSAGIEILVGQDDASNDAVTFDVGHPNDVWLHVAGTPGSHVILRCGEAATEPDRESIREAAGLAAWFSRMRKGGRVTVHHCRVRDVRKPRGAGRGKVTIRNFGKIAARPALLDEEEAV